MRPQNRTGASDVRRSDSILPHTCTFTFTWVSAAMVVVMMAGRLVCAGGVFPKITRRQRDNHKGLGWLVCACVCVQHSLRGHTKQTRTPHHTSNSTSSNIFQQQHVQHTVNISTTPCRTLPRIKHVRGVRVNDQRHRRRCRRHRRCIPAPSTSHAIIANDLSM